MPYEEALFVLPEPFSPRAKRGEGPAKRENQKSNYILSERSEVSPTRNNSIVYTIYYNYILIKQVPLFELRLIPIYMVLSIDM